MKIIVENIHAFDHVRNAVKSGILLFDDEEKEALHNEQPLVKQRSERKWSFHMFIGDSTFAVTAPTRAQAEHGWFEFIGLVPKRYD